MITEAKLKYALKEMMEECPLEEINVTALCQRCGCHRQTFYYHYQDIYDLIAAIFLNEEIFDLEKAKTAEDVLMAFLKYSVDNFSFLRATYNSAARDLTEDFIFGKLNAKLLSLWRGNKDKSLKIDGKRKAARRFAHAVAGEFGNCFKDTKLTPEKFEKTMKQYIYNSIDTLLPAVRELSKLEEKE